MNEKKLIPEIPAVKSKIEAVIEKYSSQPIFARLVAPFSENDKYIIITVEAIFNPKYERENVCFTKLLNEIAHCNYELFSIREIGVGCFMLIFKREK